MTPSGSCIQFHRVHLRSQLGFVGVCCRKGARVLMAVYGLQVCAERIVVVFSFGDVKSSGWLFVTFSVLDVQGQLLLS